jgi:hypothetical protein
MVDLIRNDMLHDHIKKKKIYPIHPMLASRVMRYVKVNVIIKISMVDLVKNNMRHGHIKNKKKVSNCFVYTLC